ncbi:hypothetical protein [Actinoplanes sp. N902-109]|uniref:hypothetical protein n=1 Tax=Actinoplanes sp. (strain N902-109) TaxID=649831 RepID=UPI00059F755F|nr:hypothetical protein [Actinoplanes sp. N902-109]
MADKTNAPRDQRRASQNNTHQTTSKDTRCRQVETVSAALVMGPCDRCKDCDQPGSWDVDHWTVCPARTESLRHGLAEVLAGGGDRG